MRSVLLDGVNLRVSRWAFGTASLHRVVASTQRQRLLASAVDTGFTHYDTSPYYGYGIAEASLGEFLRRRREHVTVATKVGLYPPFQTSHNALSVLSYKIAKKVVARLPEVHVDWSVATAEASLSASLARLRTDYVDVLFLHEPQLALINADEFLRWLEHEYTRGRIRAWGLAGQDVAQLPWVRETHPLASVLQIKDSLDKHEADAIVAAGRSLHFTYGYLSALQRNVQARVNDSMLDEVLRRNPHGSILVSTLRQERVARFAAAADRESCM